MSKFLNHENHNGIKMKIKNQKDQLSELLLNIIRKLWIIKIKTNSIKY